MNLAWRLLFALFCSIDFYHLPFKQENQGSNSFKKGSFVIGLKNTVCVLAFYQIPQELKCFFMIIYVDEAKDLLNEWIGM